MDDTEVYINMCDKSDEIQKLGREREGGFEAGDYLYDKDDKKVYPVVKSWWYKNSSPVYEVMGGDIIKVDDWIWLPKQSQLQKMLQYPIGEFKDYLWTTLDELHKYAFHEDFSRYIPMSMEQLWLCFVMKKRWNKIWTGKNWSKQ